MSFVETLGDGARTATEVASLPGLVLFHFAKLSLHEDTASYGELVSDSVEMVLVAFLGILI